MSKEKKEILGKRVKALRSYLKLSRKDFASVIGIAASYLSGVESGKVEPGFDFFYKITTIYPVNLYYLLHGERPKFLLGESKNESKGKDPYGGLKQHFGANYNPIRKMLKYLELSDVVAESVLEHFAFYLLEKGEAIALELKKKGYRIEGNEIKEIKKPEE